MIPIAWQVDGSRSFLDFVAATGGGGGITVSQTHLVVLRAPQDDKVAVFSHQIRVD